MQFINHSFAAVLFLLSSTLYAQKLYIAENGATEIRRCNEDGTLKELVSGGTGNVLALRSMVVDEQRNTVFWIESNTVIKKAALIPNAGVTQLGTSANFANVSGANFQSLAIHPTARELFVSSNGGIYILDLDETFTVTALPVATISPFNISTIDIDVVNSKIYFVRPITTTEIWIANLDGTGQIRIVDDSQANDIAIDPIGGKIYYTRNIFFPIAEGQVVSRDLTTGANPLSIITGEPNSLRGITVDHQNGFIFWANGASGTAGTIGRSGLDGSGKLNIFTGLNNPVDVALDLSTTIPPKLYWTEGGIQEIHRINTDGSDFERYYFGGFSPFPTGIAIDPNARTIFWTDGQHNNIKRGLIGETDFDNPEVILDYPDAAPGMQGLDIDPENTMIYFADVDNGRIQRADYSNPVPITGSDIVTIANPFGIDLDLINGKIYYTANDLAAINRGTLYRANLDGSSPETLWTDLDPDPQRYIHDVKVDPINGLVYWVWTEANNIATIYKANISDVNGTATPLVNPTGGEVRGLEIDPQTNKIWWVCRGIIGTIPPSIMQANLNDGSNRSVLHQISFLPPNANFIILDKGTTTPLQLTGTTAVANATNVSVSDNLTFTFDQSVAAVSVNSNNIIVRGEQTGIIAGTFSGAGTTTVTFNPTNDFKAGEVIRVTLTNGLLSTTGGNLAPSQSYQFTTSSSVAPETPPFFIEHVLSSTAGDSFGIFPADIDGDGDMDAVGTAAGNNAVLWFENDGNDNFTEIIVSNTANGPSGIYAEDIDSDGDMDILSTSQSGGAILWFENDGSENFTERTVTTNAGAPGKVYASDLDGDGDMDVVSTSFAPSAGSIANARLNYYINDGSENFTQFNISTVNGTSAYPIDVDGDGDIDLVATSEAAAATTLFDNELSWFENDGALNYTEHIIDPTSRIQVDSYATDMDGDGDVDFLMVGSLSFVGWFENDGNENFTEHEIGSAESQPRSIHASDIDGDGDMDVLTTHELLDEVVLWLNDGSQNFTRQSITTNADLAWDVYAADMDGDGDMDILSASRFDDKLAWYENILAACANLQPITAIPFSVTTNTGQPITVDVVAGATLNTGDVVVVTLETNPSLVTAVVNSDNTITISSATAGTDSFDYRITNQCDVFDVNTVDVQIDDVPQGVVVYNGLSPNSDNLNPWFRIDNIETYQPNTVRIYNRWGDKVFEINNYTNSDPNRRFNGISDDGKELPNGIYFYRIEFDSGQDSLEGYITLKR